MYTYLHELHIFYVYIYIYIYNVYIQRFSTPRKEGMRLRLRFCWSGVWKRMRGTARAAPRSCWRRAKTGTRPRYAAFFHTNTVKCCGCARVDENMRNIGEKVLPLH